MKYGFKRKKASATVQMSRNWNPEEESKLKTTKLFLAWQENLIKSVNRIATDLGCCKN